MAAIQLKPDLGAAYGELAGAANEAKNYELVIRVLDARAKLLPELPIGYFYGPRLMTICANTSPQRRIIIASLKKRHGQFPDQEFQARHRLIAIEPRR